MRDPADLATLAKNIRAELEAEEGATRQSLRHAIEAGRLLLEAKDRLMHGQWLPWLHWHCQISERTAQHRMRLARHAPELANAKHVSDLTVRAAIALLAEPPAEPPLLELVEAIAESPVGPASPLDRAWAAASLRERRAFMARFGPAREQKGRLESPTFVATFVDGETTRMTVATPLDSLDVRRAVRIAHAAYWQRCRREPPAIVEAKFENGKTLAVYRAAGKGVS